LTHVGLCGVGVTHAAYKTTRCY